MVTKRYKGSTVIREVIAYPLTSEDFFAWQEKNGLKNTELTRKQYAKEHCEWKCSPEGQEEFRQQVKRAHAAPSPPSTDDVKRRLNSILENRRLEREQEIEREK